MSKTLTAVELKKEFSKILHKRCGFDFLDDSTNDVAEELALKSIEIYKSKVESITDEEIKKAEKHYEIGNGILHAISYRKGAKWLKQKLLE